MNARKYLRQALVGPGNHELPEIQVASFTTHATANLRGLNNCRERGCQRVNILGWNQLPIDTFHNGVADRADRRADHSKARCHGFDNDHRQAFVAGR
jgi:hypothetical protein